MQKNIIDISWPITKNMTTYKDNKPITIAHDKNFEAHNVRDTTITLNAHTGTHIDAPSHFLKDGRPVDMVGLRDYLIGPCRVLDLTHVIEYITAQDLEKFHIKKNEIILLKTQNSQLEPTELFKHDFIYLEKSGAEFLAEKDINTVGIDYLGIEANQPDHDTHKFFFEKNITIIEGLRLHNINEGNYFLCCLPLAFQNIEAAPARAVLFAKPEHFIWP